jgi:hypothetical protein
MAEHSGEQARPEASGGEAEGAPGPVIEQPRRSPEPVIEPPASGAPMPVSRPSPVFARRGVTEATPSGAARHRVLRPPPSMEEREMVLERALRDIEHSCERTPFGFDTIVRLGRRKQRVQVIYENPDVEGDRLILVQTTCGPASSKNHRWALRLNLRLAFGRVAIRRTGTKDMFVFVQTLFEDHTQPAELRKAIKEAAERGDWIEKQLLGGKDVH